ncbi:MAG: thioredoxin family protein [Candidatus Coatesbacteria bacterium]|nr:thioredoxin family protein [Candidatus Coatesbacteria bacterium]
MKRRPNKSIFTMAITLAVITLFIWHFGRKFEQMKQKPEPDSVVLPSSKAEVDRSIPDSTVLNPASANKPILACFCAEWGSSCPQMKDLVGQMQSRFGDGLQTSVIDPSKEPELAKQFRIETLPTIIIFDAKGNLTLRHEGALAEEELLTALNRVCIK